MAFLQPTRARVRSLLVLTALGALVWTAFVLASGGFSVRIGGDEVFRSHRAVVPAGISLLLFVVACFTGGPDGSGLRRVLEEVQSLGDRLDRAAPRLAVLLGVITCGIGIEYGAFAAGGADSYGYMSQAQLWTRLTLRVEQPLARQAPWPHPEWTLSPLGYRPATVPAAIVPTYSPGFPMTMAPVMAIGGATAGYYVVPVLGAWLVWLTSRLGARLGNRTVGLLGALLLLSSPVFLVQLLQPMSDVPVAAWWIASLLLATRTGLLPATASGLVAAIAILTRPNLVPLAIAPLVTIMLGRTERGGLRAALPALAFCAGVLPGVAGVAALNSYLYGSPLASGYGNLEGLYEWANIRPNASRYLAWTYATHSVLPLAAPAGPWLLERVRGGAGDARALLAGSLVLMILVIASYLPYAVFEEWWYLRFLMPGLPIALVLCAATMVGVARALPAALRTVAILALGAVIVGSYSRFAAKDGVFVIGAGETRYRRGGILTRQIVPANGVLLAVQHSGAGRWYGERVTIRWDWMDPAWLDRAVAWLDARDQPPFLLLDEWEEAPFRQRFGAASRLGLLDWPPAAEARGGGGIVRIYNLADRERYMAGGRVQTVRLFDR